MKRTPLRKISERQKEKNVEKVKRTKELHQWFIDEIWSNRKHYCESCNKWLGDIPKTIFFDHLIEKSLRPDLEFISENIFLCCDNCHISKTNGFPPEKHKLAIKEAKKYFEI